MTELLIYVSALLGGIHRVALLCSGVFAGLGTGCIIAASFHPLMSPARRKFFIRKGWSCLQLTLIFVFLVLTVPCEGTWREMFGL
nr:MAG TPA: hypothetical protein [Caudoviricetes sp.]